MHQPHQDEYAPYYHQYIQKVPQGSIIELLLHQIDEVAKIFSGISEENSLFRYAEGKWNIKEILGHIVDTERIFACRALRFSRNDKTNLPGFEQNDFVHNANYNELKLSDLLEEFITLRRSNLKMFNNFSVDMWIRKGTANGNLITVRAIAFILYGHAIHHLTILRDRYLK